LQRLSENYNFLPRPIYLNDPPRRCWRLPSIAILMIIIITRESNYCFCTS